MTDRNWPSSSATRRMMRWTSSRISTATLVSRSSGKLGKSAPLREDDALALPWLVGLGQLRQRFHQIAARALRAAADQHAVGPIVDLELHPLGDAEFFRQSHRNAVATLEGFCDRAHKLVYTRIYRSNQ